MPILSSPDRHFIDVPKVLKHFGGRAATFQKLRASGAEIKIQTLDKWRARRTIPTPRLLALVEIARKMRRPLDLKEFSLLSP